MERIKVTVVCDRCQQDTDLKPGSGIEIALGAYKAEVDLCSDCLEHLTIELQPVLDNGRGENKPRRKRAVKALIVCPDCHQECREGAGYTLHRMKKHGEGIVEEQHDYAEATG